MIIGLGTDIVELARMESALARTPKLAERVLTPNEMQGFQQAREPARYLAKRFSAKEAAVKALGTGIAKGVTWHDVEISRHESGRPLLSLSGQAAEHACQMGINSWLLSYSDERHYVIATVLAQRC